MVIVCAQLNKQVQYLVYHFGRAGAVPVNLVDHYQRRLVQTQRLFQHKAGLGHTALKSVYQQQNAVYHGKNTLYLAAKVRMAGRVYNVDLGVVIVNGGVLGHNGNAPLTLQVVAVHDPLFHHFILTEGAALAQHFVHQSGFAVVNMGNDCNVFYIFSCTQSAHPNSYLFFLILKLSRRATVRLNTGAPGAESLSIQK